MVMPVRLSHLKSDLVECDTHGGGYLARWCSLALGVLGPLSLSGVVVVRQVRTTTTPLVLPDA